MKLVNVWFRCTSCRLRTGKHVLSILKDTIPYTSCPKCGAPMVVEKKCRNFNDNIKRSRDQEKRAAKRYGGKRQVASGSTDYAKGDVRMKDIHRGECKFTRAQSYNLKLQDLIEIEKHAAGNEKPFLEIEFQGVFPTRRYVILPDWAFKTLIGGTVGNSDNR